MDEKRERRWIPGEKADYVKELVEIINQEERDDQLAEKLSAYHENDIAEAFELLDEKGRRKLYRVRDTQATFLLCRSSRGSVMTNSCISSGSVTPRRVSWLSSSS